MKKVLLFVPLITCALFSCNQNQEEKEVTYLELFSNQAKYFNDEIRSTITTKIENKRYIEKCEVNYSSTDHEPLVENKETYTYNAHGDYDRVIKEQKKLKYEEISYRIDEYTYQYREDGLIDWMKIKHTDENEVVSYTLYTYEYDDLKRLTSELRETSNDGIDYISIYDSTFTYEKDFTTYATNTVWNIKEAEYITTTSNKFDHDGYVIEQTIKTEDRPKNIIMINQREVYTYDDYHCVTHIDLYKTSSGEEKLSRSSNCTYHKNNPNKLLTQKNTFYKNNNAKSEILEINYTYDEYDRKDSCKTKIEASGTPDIEKLVWEYDQLIEA